MPRLSRSGLVSRRRQDAIVDTFMKRLRIKASSPDQAVGDLVGYLSWMAEPAQNQRIRIGAWVLMFLAVVFVLVWRLNAAFWKNVK